MDGVGKIVEGVNALEAALNSNRVRKVFVLDKKSNKSNPTAIALRKFTSTKYTKLPE